MSGKTPLYFVEGTLDTPGYIKLLEDCFMPWKRSKRISGCILQQDNAPCHVSKAAKAFMEAKKIDTLPWPANSPDLNPIENLWAILKSKVAKRSPKTVPELKAVLVEEWDRIPIQTIQSLVQSMPKRLSDCIKSKGGYTTY